MEETKGTDDVFALMGAHKISLTVLNARNRKTVTQNSQKNEKTFWQEDTKCMLQLKAEEDRKIAQKNVRNHKTANH